MMIVTLLTLGSGCGERIADERGTQARCDLHDVELQEGVIPIRYGYPMFAPQEIEGVKRFPYANTFRFGGCMTTSDSPKKARIRFCPKCREEVAALNREYARTVLIPVAEYRDRVQTILGEEAFLNVRSCIHYTKNQAVGFEGTVASEADLVRLKLLAEAANPPQPLIWDVKIIR
ncbi:hypothetical protein [Limnoglobus roseus]|uniref:hypothetical protein n=1 Tax=Limnoglobus roseus TaxID=2598579 RepID=UPI0011EAAA68|nr:hypothetical protein [Limnoglobus roseus]